MLVKQVSVVLVTKSIIKCRMIKSWRQRWRHALTETENLDRKSVDMMSFWDYFPVVPEFMPLWSNLPNTWRSISFWIYNYNVTKHCSFVFPFLLRLCFTCCLLSYMPLHRNSFVCSLTLLLSFFVHVSLPYVVVEQKCFHVTLKLYLYYIMYVYNMLLTLI